MAEGYQTEDEQIEALKKWWNENGKSTLASIAVAIVGVFGWQGWQDQKQANIESASAIYQNLLVSSQGQQGEVTDEQQATANHLANTLKEDFPNSTYALFAALYKAKFLVAEDDLAGAEQELQWVLDNDPTPALMEQAQLRLARVLYAQDKYAEALSQLSNQSLEPSASSEELKGDILFAQGDHTAADKAYNIARQLILDAGNMPSNRLLDMKIQQLSGKQSENTASTSEQSMPSDEDA